LDRVAVRSRGAAGLACALALLVAPARRAAAVEYAGAVAAALSVFAEPAPTQHVVVVTPSAGARVQIGTHVAVAVDWTADIVTGATPRVYGSPDVVTAATAFDEQRNSIAATVEAGTGPFTARAGYRFGIENDYRSHVLVLGAALDLFAHNTLIAATYAHNFDSVCDLNNQGLPPTLRQSLGTSRRCFSGIAGLTEEPLDIDGVELSITQTLTPRLVGALIGSYEHLDGFQSNPYRRVRLNGGAIEAQESHPRLRDRGAVTGRLRYAVGATRGALGLDLRLYRDTWSIQSITVETSWDQLHLKDRLRWRVRARWYQQSRASFYRDAGQANSYERAGPVGDFFTGDRELAPFGDLLLGGAIFYRPRPPAARRLGRIFTALDVGLRVDLVKVFAFTPSPPDVERTRGVVNALDVAVTALGQF
jgi:hypothetical protein